MADRNPAWAKKPKNPDEKATPTLGVCSCLSEIAHLYAYV